MPVLEETLSLLEKEGIRKEEYPNLERDFRDAVANDRFISVEKEGRNIGFLSYKRILGNRVFVSSLFIYKDCRGVKNLFHLRKLISKKFNDNDIFVWKNRKRQIYKGFRTKGTTYA